MPHFLVDDHAHDHWKFRAAGLEATGLWTLSGAWCRDNLSDGFVPAHVAERYAGKRLRAMAKRLVDAVLWHPITDARGEAGWLFHDWCGPCPICKATHEADDSAGWQSSREEVLAQRRRNAARQKRFRDRKPIDPDPPDSNALRNNESSGVTDDATNSVSNTAPARPGQTKSKHLLTLVSRLAAGDARGTPPPADRALAETITAWQDHAGPGVDLEAEAAAYLIRFGDRPATDERGAWLGFLAKARRRAEAAQPAPPRTPCPACDNGFLLDDDHRPTPCPQCKPHLRLAHPEAS